MLSSQHCSKAGSKRSRPSEVSRGRSRAPSPQLEVSPHLCPYLRKPGGCRGGGRRCRCSGDDRSRSKRRSGKLADPALDPRVAFRHASQTGSSRRGSPLRERSLPLHGSVAQELHPEPFTIFGPGRQAYPSALRQKDASRVQAESPLAGEHGNEVPNSHARQAHHLSLHPVPGETTPDELKGEVPPQLGPPILQAESMNSMAVETPTSEPKNGSPTRPSTSGLQEEDVPTNTATRGRPLDEFGEQQGVSVSDSWENASRMQVEIPPANELGDDAPNSHARQARHLSLHPTSVNPVPGETDPDELETEMPPQPHTPNLQAKGVNSITVGTPASEPKQWSPTRPSTVGLAGMDMPTSTATRGRPLDEFGEQQSVSASDSNKSREEERPCETDQNEAVATELAEVKFYREMNNITPLQEAPCDHEQGVQCKEEVDVWVLSDGEEDGQNDDGIWLSGADQVKQEEIIATADTSAEVMFDASMAQPVEPPQEVRSDHQGGVQCKREANVVALSDDVQDHPDKHRTSVSGVVQVKKEELSDTTDGSMEVMSDADEVKLRLKGHGITPEGLPPDGPELEALITKLFESEDAIKKCIYRAALKEVRDNCRPAAMNVTPRPPSIEAPREIGGMASGSAQVSNPAWQLAAVQQALRQEIGRLQRQQQQQQQQRQQQPPLRNANLSQKTWRGPSGSYIPQLSNPGLLPRLPHANPAAGPQWVRPIHPRPRHLTPPPPPPARGAGA